MFTTVWYKPKRRKVVHTRPREKVETFVQGDWATELQAFYPSYFNHGEDRCKPAVTWKRQPRANRRAWFDLICGGQCSLCGEVLLPHCAAPFYRGFDGLIEKHMQERHDNLLVAMVEDGRMTLQCPIEHCKMRFTEDRQLFQHMARAHERPCVIQCPLGPPCTVVCDSLESHARHCYYHHPPPELRHITPLSARFDAWALGEQVRELTESMGDARIPVEKLDVDMGVMPRKEAARLPMASRPGKRKRAAQVVTLLQTGDAVVSPVG